MAALNRFFSTPAILASCVAALWIGFIAGALAYNQSASQATKVHQLGFFSQYALNLVQHLQLERATMAAFAASGHSGQSLAYVKDRQNKTDAVYQSFKKHRGRFNSEDYGVKLTDSLEEAVAQLSGLNEIRSRALTGNADINALIGAYNKAIEQLDIAISQLGTVELEDPEAVKLRDLFLGHLQAGELSAREMLHLQPGDASQSEWLNDLEKQQNNIVVLARAEFQELLTKTGKEAARRAYFFVISLLTVVIATLAAIAWCKPSIFDQSLLITLIVFNAALILWTLTTGPFWISKESGPIESLHTIMLAVTFALFCREAVKYPGASRVAAAIMACLCLLMFFRELDLRVFDAPAWLINITTPRIRKWLSFALIVITVIYAASCYKELPSLARSSLSWNAWPFYAWPLLLIVGERVELITHETRQDDLPGYWANGQFWEELLELNAYLAVLYCAYIFADVFRNNTKPVSAPGG